MTGGAVGHGLVGGHVVKNVAVCIGHGDVSEGEGADGVGETELDPLIGGRAGNIVLNHELLPAVGISVDSLDVGHEGIGTKIDVAVGGGAFLGGKAFDLVVTLNGYNSTFAQSLNGTGEGDAAIIIGGIDHAQGTLGSVAFGADRKTTDHCDHRQKQCESRQDRDETLAK